MRISDWSSDVCSSDLHEVLDQEAVGGAGQGVCQGHVLGLGTECLGKLPLDIGGDALVPALGQVPPHLRSEEHTSELQSLMRISYAVFCLQKKRTITINR